MNTEFSIVTSSRETSLLDAKGEPHLTDFGLARLVESESSVTQTLDVLRHTQLHGTGTGRGEQHGC